MDFNLRGKSVLIAASSQGLGRAIAEMFLAEGANVMISGREEDKLKNVATQLQTNSNGTVYYKKTDITKAEDIESLVAETVEKLGTIDILINNAGGPPAGNFESITDEDWYKSFELNLLSYVRMIRAALPYLKRNGGKIINIASTSIKEPIPGLILSNTFRTGIVGLAKTLSQEFAPYNILVNTVAPGRINTDRVKHLDEVTAKKLGSTREKVETEAKNNIPLNRYGSPEEFAKVVVFLASDANAYMTGSAFLVDGGMVKSI
ncbi:SDR family oxidoreductase [Neobacillus sp. D3-1R]|uniref:SDR family oxidoreductase n=1 Tax=Neobacillus sp. D3-1R TaxID=3445778 RepID=UPI003F9F75F2